MSRNKTITWCAVVACLGLSYSTFACGPDYRYWYHISDPVRFDPLIPKASDSAYVFGQMFPRKGVRRDIYRDQKEELNKTYTALDVALSQHRPDVFFLTPDKYSEFHAKHCFVGKYYTLWRETDSIMRSITKRTERFDIEQNHPDGTAGNDYRPEFDRISDPAAFGILSDLPASGAADRYSSYFSSVRNNLTPCYGDTANPSKWPAAREYLLHLQDKPEYSTWSKLALLVGYVNNGSARAAREVLQELAVEPVAPALEQLNAEVQYLVTEYEKVLRDDTVIEHRPLFRLNLSSRQYGWGSCSSNSFDSLRHFGTAVIADEDLSDATVQELLTYRAQLLASCLDNSALPNLLETLQANQETSHHAYLLAATYFYLRDYDKAQDLFLQLAAKKVPWVSETSLYLVARSLMLAGQSDWNGYYRDDTIDKALVLESADAFARYLSAYPDGRYVASASGLIRRAHWLAGDLPTYRNMLLDAKNVFLDESESGAAWTQPETHRLEALFDEYKLRGGFYDPGNSLSVLVAFVGEEPVAGVEKFQPFSRANEFIAAKKAFDAQDFAAVIKHYESESDLNSAELILLARSYEQDEQIARALDLWRTDLAETGLGQSTIDYEVSKVLYNNHGVEGVVRDENIGNVSVKRVYLASLCDVESQKKLMAEALPDETKHAVFVDLALRYLFADDFQALHELFEAQPNSVIGEYSAITTAVRDIANGRSLGKGYMNVAYFLQAVVQTPLFGLENYLVEEDASQCRQNTVAAGVNGPYYYFNKSLEYFDAGEPSVAEQKSLHYLTMCFKQGTASRTCLWGDRPDDGLSSKEAFTRLHAKYKDSEWAKKTKYHY